MTTVDAEAQGYHEEDRLPWLESAEEDYQEGPSASRVIALIILGLLVIAAAIYGYNWFRNHPAATGTGELIKAPEGDYKVKPDEPGGMKVDGEGDAVFSTSEGGVSNGSIDTGAVSEAPITGKVAAQAKDAPATPKIVAAVPPSGGTLTAKIPAAPAVKASGGGGSLVQLGSFPTEGAANTAWSGLSKRFAYLAPLGKSVEKAEVNGRTVYRLRVNAGSTGNASELCGKLKVAGEACYIPN